MLLYDCFSYTKCELDIRWLMAMFVYFLRLHLTNSVFLAISNTVRDILERAEYFHII